MTKISPKYNLQTMNPKVAKQWHPTNNGLLTPKDVTPGSNKKAWWKCKQKHEWQASICNRNKGRGCPFCSGKKVSIDNCLHTVNPSLANEWHPIKNISVTSKQVTPNSNKLVWWICDNGHEWKAQIASRNKGRGCPYCTGRKIYIGNSLQFINPILSKEWHHTKNKTLMPKDVAPNSHKLVWWVCDKGHEWKSSIAGRNRGRGCPFCAGRKVCIENSLYTVYPILAGEWHPNKNDPLTAMDVTSSSSKKVWWACKKGHEWLATVNNRSKGTGCPFCHSATSELELRVFTEMKYIFNKVDHRKKVFGVECDIFISDIELGIEIDGVYWHKDKYAKDRKKTNLLKNEGIPLIRVREKELRRISDNDIFFASENSHYDICCGILKKVLQLIEISSELKNRIKDYLRNGEIKNNSEFMKLLDMLPSPLPGFSLEECNKSLAREWHPSRNEPLSPKDVFPNSTKRIWWVCDKGHEWETTVNSRNMGTGCPYCTGQRVSIDNSLHTKNPNLSREWHPTNNGSLTPKDVTSGSGRKVWWVCDKGHEWETTVNSRNRGRGCSYCSGQRVSLDNSLYSVNPILSKEWHPMKNDPLTPKGVLTHSNKKVWWICKKNHEWETTVDNRTKGKGCPYCTGRKAAIDNCLFTKNPNLSGEWHPYKNGTLSPKDVTSGSGRKVWWACKKGHEWLATVNSRNKGNACPKCYELKRRKLKE